MVRGMAKPIPLAFLVAAFLVGLALGFLLANILDVGQSGNAPTITARLAEKPRLVNVRVPVHGENRTTWSLSVDVTVDGSKLSCPLAIRDVRAYVKVAYIDVNLTQWIMAEKNVIGGVKYTYWGDSIVLPHSQAILRIGINSPVSKKPLAVIVAVEFENGETVYSNIVALP